MKKKPSSEGLDNKEPSWEEAVGRYLQQTPDYFLRHPELLSGLAVPHLDTGRAVSLVERQVRVLRDRHDHMAQQLQELIGFARDNDQLGERVQRFALAMIDTDSVDDVLDTAHDMLRQEFNLDGVAVRLTGNPRPPCQRPEFSDAEDEVLDGLLARLAERNGLPLCGATHEPATLVNLFGVSAADIRSTAVIGLTRHALRGVLVLASHDAQRFRADMGSVYLVRLGELLMASVARHLVVATE